MKILKTGYICDKWYGDCNNCHTIVEATLDDFHTDNHHIQVVKEYCPFCNALMNFHREDTIIGDNIRLKCV